MRIGSRVILVGAIPIAVAAVIAAAAVVLSNSADQARGGAVLASTIYRTLLAAVMARDGYLNADPSQRGSSEERVHSLIGVARDDLTRLHGAGREADQHLIADTDRTLSRYADNMGRLVQVTSHNDALVAEMAARATSLIGLTDQARERQHASNAEIVKSLAEGDKKLLAARDIVEAAYNLRLIIALLQIGELDIKTNVALAAHVDTQRELLFNISRLRHGIQSLAKLLTDQGSTDQAKTIVSLGHAYDARAAVLEDAVHTDQRVAGWDNAAKSAVQALATWAEQLLKLNSAEYRSLHDEAAQLLTYSVQAHETEQATQNIAIQTLKLGNRSASALARRDPRGSRAVLNESASLPETIAALPISPLIQSEMVDALQRWRGGLDTTTQGLVQQNALISGMDEATSQMINAAGSLDAAFTAYAERIGGSVRTILMLGAAFGLLVGGGVAFLVARSIARPLVALRHTMTDLAEDTDEGEIHGNIPDDGRRDELGDMARAANVFITEIARRERVIRRAKDRADLALEDLRRTQVELIQAEKLASLGQLVAGVAHEINTPVGIALTTASVLDDEVRLFRESARTGAVSRSAFERLVERVSEGARLLSANLTRAADLVQSFKHVAADQVSGERRTFDMQIWLQELLTSLGPMLRKAGHQVVMTCPEGVTLDTHPGALAQVVTNLVVNAQIHAFAPDTVGQIRIAILESARDQVTLTVEDNGLGIAAADRAKVFDPFFTTKRSEGSTGLGLHIVYNLVAATLQGRIDMHSVPGEGTRFTVTLPKSPAVLPAGQGDERAVAASPAEAAV